MLRSSPNNVKREQIVLAIGDAVIFVFFAMQGRATHEISLGPNPVLTVLTVAAPFAVPWFIVAWAFGTFRPDVIRRVGHMLLQTAAAWLCAGCIGLVARAILLQRPLLPMFAIAVLGINGALLLGWRLIVSLIEQYFPKRHVS